MFTHLKIASLFVAAVAAFGASASAHEACGHDHDHPVATAAQSGAAAGAVDPEAADPAAQGDVAPAGQAAAPEPASNGMAPPYLWDYRTVVHYACGHHFVYYVRIGGVTQLRCLGDGQLFMVHIPF